MANLQSKISDLMAQKKISGLDLEKKTGINRNTIYSIISGTSKNPSANKLQLISNALGVSLESILIDEEEIQFNTMSENQMRAFSEATSTTINIIIEKKLDFSLDNLLSLIKEVYQYSIKAEPHNVDERFVQWLLEKHNH